MTGRHMYGEVKKKRDEEGCQFSDPINDGRFSLLQPTEVKGLVVGDAVAPAGGEDGDPPIGEDAHGGMVAATRVPLHQVEGAGPERVANGVFGEHAEGLAQKAGQAGRILTARCLPLVTITGAVPAYCRMPAAAPASLSKHCRGGPPVALNAGDWWLLGWY